MVKKQKKPTKKELRLQRDDELAKVTSKGLAKLLAEQGVNVMTADQLILAQDLRRPSGIASLDVNIGGGLAGGTSNLFFGPESSGKTWLAIKFLVQQQRLWGSEFSALYCTMGPPMDKSFARMHGLQLPYAEGEKDKWVKFYQTLHRAPPTEEQVENAGAKVGQLLFAFPDLEHGDPTERMLQTVVESVRTRKFGMVIVDDLGGMAPSGRTQELWKTPQPGVYANLITNWINQTQNSLQMYKGSFNFTTVLVISQVRMTMNVQGGKPGGQQSPTGGMQSVGGRGIRHMVSCRMKLYMDKPPTGARTMKYSVTKGKFGHGDGASGEFKFNPLMGVDVVEDLVETAITYGVVEVDGKRHSFGGTELVEGSKHGLIARLESNPEEYERVYAALMHHACPGIRYR
jgi:RecA/RadA recombinase